MTGWTPHFPCVPFSDAKGKDLKPRPLRKLPLRVVLTRSRNMSGRQKRGQTLGPCGFSVTWACLSGGQSLVLDGRYPLRLGMERGPVVCGASGGIIA